MLQWYPVLWIVPMAAAQVFSASGSGFSQPAILRRRLPLRCGKDQARSFSKANNYLPGSMVVLVSRKRSLYSCSDLIVTQAAQG